ncbi:hypothetical protein BJV74DRAFT_887208 [Russula compacta]|nr:hypothetical protein BJV74DRAFT_887208 [Russula compacta]
MNRLFSQLSSIIANYLFPSTSSISISRSSDPSDVEKGLFVPQLSVEERQGQRQEATIGTLSDQVLLIVFNFYLDQAQGEDRWYPLVHVCRTWRSVVYSSPHRLNLQLLCSQKKPVRKTLDVWPDLPIVISGRGNPSSYVHGADNIIAALDHPDRVRHISLLEVPIPALEIITAAMCEPFPDLTYLELLPHDTKMSVPVLPDTFLGGSVPRLRTLWLDFIPLGGLRKLLLSASDLVDLRLLHIPNSGYIPPETMVTCLSAMTRLETLNLGFHSPRSRPDRASRHPPLTRAVLPALTQLWFQGVSEYLDDLVARINTPSLRMLEIVFFHQLVFNISHLPQFISRTEVFDVLNEAYIVFHRDFAQLRGSWQKNTAVQRVVAVGILCKESEWQLSSLSQACISSLPPFPALERLDIIDGHSPRPQWHDDMENAQWLEPLRPFTAVKNLYLSKGLGLRVARALRELPGERAVEVLPALQNIFFGGLQSSGPARDAIRPFITARQLSGHPVAIHCWEDGQ